jgi:hypothetical protein
MSQSDSTNEPDEVEESYVVTNIEARFLAAFRDLEVQA